MKLENLTVEWDGELTADICDGKTEVGFVGQNCTNRTWGFCVYEIAGSNAPGVESYGLPSMESYGFETSTDAIIGMFDYLRLYLLGVPIPDRSYPRFEPELPPPSNCVVCGGKDGHRSGLWGHSDFAASSMNSHKVEFSKKA